MTRDAGEALAREAELVGRRLDGARDGVGRAIFGQREVVDLTTITLLCGGHGLLVGVPGLGKTRLVETVAVVFGLDAARVQFTPDLMPADILGSEVLEEGADGRRAFRFIEGPVFTQLLMADEINRASPRTQSALLQAMQERRVAVAGQHRDLPRPFHVLATQNPIEQEGTYALPEAQLDRFLLEIRVPYPDIETERRILVETTGVEEAPVEPVMSPADLMEAQRLVRRMPIGTAVVDTILDVVRSARPEPSAAPWVRDVIAWGPGPRAAQALMLATRARALMDGRLSPSPDDVMALAAPVLRHRMALTFSARADGATVDEVVDRLLEPVARAA